jgi:crossover junction endodeoxyribonuclease RusA
LSLSLHPPAPWLTANGRRQHRWEATTRRAWRDAGCLHARSAKLPRLERAHIEVTIQFRDNRRRDIANWHPTAKALVDGFVDYGLLPDDDDRHLIGPDMRRGPAVSGLAVAGLVTVRIRPLEVPA